MYFYAPICYLKLACFVRGVVNSVKWCLHSCLLHEVVCLVEIYLPNPYFFTFIRPMYNEDKS